MNIDVTEEQALKKTKPQPNRKSSVFHTCSAEVLTRAVRCFHPEHLFSQRQKNQLSSSFTALLRNDRQHSIPTAIMLKTAPAKECSSWPSCYFFVSSLTMLDVLKKYSLPLPNLVGFYGFELDWLLGQKNVLRVIPHTNTVFNIFLLIVVLE